MLIQILDRSGLRGNMLAPEKSYVFRETLNSLSSECSITVSQKPFNEMKTILLIHKENYFWNIKVRYN